MKKISLHIKNSTWKETANLLEELTKSQEVYFREAIEFYNKFQKRKMQREQLKKDSYLVRKDSLNILKEFEELDYED